MEAWKESPWDHGSTSERKTVAHCTRQGELTCKPLPPAHTRYRFIRSRKATKKKPVLERPGLVKARLDDRSGPSASQEKPTAREQSQHRCGWLGGDLLDDKLSRVKGGTGERIVDTEPHPVVARRVSLPELDPVGEVDGVGDVYNWARAGRAQL